MDFLKEGLLRTDPGLFLWTIITFLVLLLILWKAAWKPIIEALDARAERIRGDLSNADKSRQDAETLLIKHKEQLDKAKTEAAEIIEKGKQEAEKIRIEIVEKANKDSKEMVDKAKNEINIAKQNALLEIKTEIVVISTEIASKLISKNLKPDEQKAFIEETMNKIRTVQ